MTGKLSHIPDRVYPPFPPCVQKHVVPQGYEVDLLTIELMRSDLAIIGPCPSINIITESWLHNSI